MKLKILPGDYSVCRIRALQAIDWSGALTFVGRTDEELSLVCETALVPADAERREHGWRALRVEGELDFSLIGILSHITGVLAAAHVSVFCVSTYNTDYILVKEISLSSAVSALSSAGFAID